MKYIVDIEDMEEYYEPNKLDYTGQLWQGCKFTWEEVRAGNGDEYIKATDLLKYVKNIILLASMLMVMRYRLGVPISVESWFRNAYYNNVILPSRGYKSSTTSDHLEGRAADTNVKATTKNIELWKQICKEHGVYWSIGLYSWGLHLGFRYDKNNQWDYR